jgi:hypothetical protein
MRNLAENPASDNSAFDGSASNVPNLGGSTNPVPH